MDTKTRFHILGKLGEGGMGLVHEAHDCSRGMRIALETLRKVDGAQLYAFKRELRAVRDLSHPNIITLYDLIAEDEQCFLTMEVIDGQDLLSYVRAERARGAAGRPAVLARASMPADGAALGINAASYLGQGARAGPRRTTQRSR